AVGSALRSGRRGRAFESPLSDMNSSFRRPIIRIAVLVGAWCCGFLFCTLIGKSLGTSWAECGIGYRIICFWKECALLLQGRLLGMEMDKGTLGQLLALTLGNREYLTPEIKMLYRRAGAAHLLALSGMHLGILYGCMRMAVRRLTYTRWRWLALAVVLWVIWSYALLTGCSMSLVRAALMMSLALVLQVCRDGRKPLDILNVSAALVLLADPAAVLDVGFQMSCAAMSGIIILGMPMCEHWARLPYMCNVVLNSLAISVSAQVGVMPLTLFYFGSIACYGAITSLVAIPLTTLIIYCGLGLYAGWAWCVPVAEWLVECQNMIMEFVSQLPGAYIEFR
ncbi:MAG: ComEC/Rec2 family competence protein, partial [Paraprevotella sp.]|nr:ComEC/Rec2 family competence protein [Paraprevotella sp.]